MQNGELILYQTDDGQSQISLKAIDGTVWLNQNELAELFGKARSTVVEHIQNILKDKELQADSVCREFRQTATDGKAYSVTHSIDKKIENITKQVSQVELSKKLTTKDVCLRKYTIDSLKQ